MRLDAKREALKNQFGTMETALGKLKNQSSWLSGQIASLPSLSGPSPFARPLRPHRYVEIGRLMTAPMLRNRYVNDSIATASPARLLTMLYDRLVLDLQRAERLFARADSRRSHQQLLHAQDIMVELNSSLKPTPGTAPRAGLPLHLPARRAGAGQHHPGRGPHRDRPHRWSSRCATRGEAAAESAANRAVTTGSTA